MNDSIPKPKRYNYLVHQDAETRSKLKNSKTVPNQFFTVREILNKFTTGQPITGMMSYDQYDGEYDNNPGEKPDFENFLPHPKTLDLVDRDNLMKRVRKDLKEIDEQKAEARNKHQREQDEKFKKSVEEYAKKNIQTDPIKTLDKA